MNKQQYPLEYMLVHKALHDETLPGRVTIPGLGEISIKRSLRHGYRQAIVELQGHRVIIMQQNLHKASVYSDRARRGERISWVAPVYPEQGPWLRIDRSVEQLFGEMFD